MTKTSTANVINWFELKAQWIARWTPRHTIQGYAMGTYALGPLNEALWHRALDIHDAWQRVFRPNLTPAKEL